MKVKKIKVTGFKSFADKVTLEFHDGVTAIVGPNGCGKSNIADAFRWVMGEQSAKSMRGGKMQDILFAGTHKRKPLGLAEVTLVFENTEGKVAVPYHEVEITRRYHRDGEAEYLLNGNPVRLKDIQSILIDVGIGKNAYAIFEQGKIDQIIQLGPEERRGLFEEAAGILKFLINRREAEKKLSEVALNCERLKDIHDEVQKEIEHLADQASRANEYQVLKEKQLLLEEEILAAKIIQLEKKEQAEKSQAEAQALKVQGHETQCSTLRASVEEERSALEKEDEALKAKERHVYEVKSLLEVRRKEQETLQERLKELHLRDRALQEEQKKLLEARERRRSEASSYSDKQHILSTDLQEQENRLHTSKEAYFASEQKLAKLRKEVDKVQEALLGQLRLVNVSSTSKQAKEHQVQNLQEKIAFAEIEEERQKGQLTTLADDEKERRAALEEAAKLGEEGRQEFNKVDREIKILSGEIEEVDRQYEISSHQLMELKARQKVLLRLREEMEGASLGTKELLKEAQKGSSPFFGQLRGLWEYFDIQPGFEEAVAAVLRPYGDTLVASSKEAWKAALAWATEKKLTDFSLVALGDAVEKSGESSLLKKVKVNGITTHFLQGKAVVENLEAALALILNKQVGEVFSQDGYFIDKSAVLFRTSQKGSSVFLREAELKVLAEKIEGLSQEAETYKKRLEVLKSTRQSGIEKRQELDKRVRSLEMQLVEKNFQLQRVTSDIERLKVSLRRLHEDKERGTVDLAALQVTLEEIKRKNNEDELKLKKTQGEKEELQRALDEALGQHKQLSENRRAEEVKFSQVGDEARKIRHTLNLLEVKDQESLIQESRMHKESKEIQEVVVHLQAKQKELAALEVSNKEQFETLSHEKEKWAAQLQKKKESLKQLGDKLAHEELLFKKESQKAQQLALNVAQGRAQLEIAQNEFKEKYLGKQPKEPKGPVENRELELKRIKEELKSYSDINLAAAASLDQYKARQNHLQKEMGDLQAASSDLNTLIATLADESSHLFNETFQAIRTHFKKNFQILFEGGEADLELTDPENILKSGVDIVAKPPGKQMRSIHLLSGGEKCLTAMALLFSMFEVKAAPFCILDEIDAPLDDTNVERFCKMVKHFADRSQFILITHNKRTMAMADRLYGVSMEEKGVSKILMMEFQHNETPTCALAAS